MFLFKWFGLKASGPAGISVEGSTNAWGSFDVIDVILFITVLAALGMAYLRASDSDVDLPVAASVVVTVLGALSTLLILYRLISPPDFGVPDISGIDQTRKIGAFIGLIAAGASDLRHLSMEHEGTSFQDAADRFGGAGGGEPPRLPPPGPPGGERAPAASPVGAARRLRRLLRRRPPAAHRRPPDGLGSSDRAGERHDGAARSGSLSGGRGWTGSDGG